MSHSHRHNPLQFSCYKIPSTHSFAVDNFFYPSVLQFEVDQRKVNTHIDICCSTKPGLLLSTVGTLEINLGLEIQQCVISCFGDFSLQASCSEVHILLLPQYHIDLTKHYYMYILFDEY